MIIYTPYNFEKFTKNELIDTVKDCCMADQHSRMDAALEKLLSNDRNKLLQVNENIDSLIDVAHDTYMSTSETDTENRARLDAQIKVYWNIKSMIEDILEIK